MSDLDKFVSGLENQIDVSPRAATRGAINIGLFNNKLTSTPSTSLQTKMYDWDNMQNNASIDRLAKLLSIN